MRDFSDVMTGGLWLERAREMRMGNAKSRRFFNSYVLAGHGVASAVLIILQYYDISEQNVNKARDHDG